MRTWNLIATSCEGRRDALLASLAELGELWPSVFRNVVLGQVAAPEVFLQSVSERLATDPVLSGALAKLLPMARVVRFSADTLVEVVAPVLEELVAAEPGRSFYVRLERRGLKGRLHSPTIERALGDRVWAAIEQRGLAPAVEFTDPDLVVAVETVGDEAGLAVLSRELRARYPFTRVR